MTESVPTDPRCATCNGEKWLIEPGAGRLIDRVPGGVRQREWAMTPCPDCNRVKFDRIWVALPVDEPEDAS